ncbi:ovalbumin-related protein X-like [Anticarsia gemmatalis]|uniref:ovalbumin-related protein X-like n=1 Tax=Anticarsia gemmatalis TaxID=129554 RepID=UPI003F763F17
MKKLAFVIIFCAFLTAQVQDIFSLQVHTCSGSKSISQDYQSAVYDFTVNLYKYVGINLLDHFVFCPHSLWIILATIAEGVDPDTKQSMLQNLNLPEDLNTRIKFYQLAVSRFVTSGDVEIKSTRVFVIDEGVKINPMYHTFISQNSLMHVVSAPMRNNPCTALEEMRRITKASLSNLDLSGNSLILDTFDYRGLWHTAFEDALVSRSPFYNHKEEQIGEVDLMNIKRKAKMAYIRSMDVKFIELPIGENERYRMIFGLALGETEIRETVRKFTNTVLLEYLNGLQESCIPIDIAIPRISITSEHDVKSIIEEFGLINLWSDPTVTGNMSEPAALPSGYVQRATVSLDTAGVRPAPHVHNPSHNAPTGLHPKLGRDFIANKPFMLGLFDTETYTCIMAALFSRPTYPIVT